MLEPDQFRGGWDRSSLPGNITIGPDCYLERRQSFDNFRSERQPGLVLGAGVRVYCWTQFSVEPTGFVEVGDRSVLVGPQFMCLERISVGQDVLISYHVAILDSDFHALDIMIRRDDAIANAPGFTIRDRPVLESRPVTIEDGAMIGVGAIILKGVTIGKGARIQPGSVVGRSVPPGATWAGNPARPIESS